MPTTPIEDVLIVGAGPVGLFLANECARRGLRARIVESRSGQSVHSKALAIFPRTLEIFDMAGLVGPFLETANRVTRVAVISHGRALAHMRFQPEESPYPLIAMVPQNITEELLAEALKSRGRAVEYDTTFVAAVESNGHVTSTLERKGRREEVGASYVVGCDGAHSAVRHLLNLSFEGAEYADSFILADVQTNDSVPADELQLCPSEFGPVAVFPMSATRRRIVATVDQDQVLGDAPTLDLVQRVLAQRAPIGIEAQALHWSSYFRIHHRQVTKLRVGRIFVAGDAAHIHSPFGGQGMNTGLGDIWNLAWKLDLALRGHGGEPLLESYSAERRPVIKQVIETTHLLTRAMGTPNRLAQTVRDTVIPMVSRLAPFQHAFVQRLSGLDVAYRGSPIVEGEGDRFFDDSLRGGEGIRSRFLLVVDTNAEAEVKEFAERLVGGLRDVLELRLADRQGITLVRPDGYVAFSSKVHGGMSALASVRVLMERQTGVAQG